MDIFLHRMLLDKRQAGGITMSKHKLPPQRFGARTLAEVVREVRTIAEAMRYTFGVKYSVALGKAIRLAEEVYKIDMKVLDPLVFHVCNLEQQKASEWYFPTERMLEELRTSSAEGENEFIASRLRLWG